MLGCRLARTSHHRAAWVIGAWSLADVSARFRNRWRFGADRGRAAPSPRAGRRWRGLAACGVWFVRRSRRRSSGRGRGRTRAGSGCAEAMATRMRRTLRVTRAPIFRSFRRMRAAGGGGELGVRRGRCGAARVTQHVGHGGEPQPQLVGAHGRGAGAVGEEVELALLDAVLHLAAGAVDAARRACGRPLAAALSEVTTKRGLAPCAAARHPLGLGDDAPAAAPAVARRPAEVGEAAGRPAGRLGVVLGPGELDVRCARPGGGCGRGRTGSRPGSPRTRPSAPPARSRCRRAAGSAPAASGRGSGRRCAPPPRPRRPRRRCWRAGASPPAGAGRRRRRAAGSSRQS